MRVFDCMLYNGEIDVLEIRLHELADVVDVFVIVEATRTFSGMPKPLYLRAQWSRIRSFAPKIRYVVVDDDIAAETAWDREEFQRNCIVRGLVDAADDDLIISADVDEIPKGEVVATLKVGSGEVVGFELLFHYFALNYRNVEGPEARIVWAVMFPYAALLGHTPHELRHAIRRRSIACRHIREAGWHFSYLADRDGVKRKIAAFSHQEYNTSEFLNAIDIERTIKDRRDFFDRPGFVWQITGITDLPRHVQDHRDRFRHLIVNGDGAFGRSRRHGASDAARRLMQRLRRLLRRPRGNAGEPIIICPYVDDSHRDNVTRAFGLDEVRGQHLPFFFWKDDGMLGPERAFEHCWQRFPDRDVLIIHTDMAPMPDDEFNSWYPALLDYVADPPDAGMVACDLLFPVKADSGHWYIQCGGGFFADGELGHVGGSVDVAQNAAGADAVQYDESYRQVRAVDWVTFGGVYIRREVLDMVGPIDRRYEWAYVMDVDYSLETRLRGLKLYQVPVNLLHEENGSTGPLLQNPEYLAKQQHNYQAFYEKWDWYLSRNAD